MQDWLSDVRTQTETTAIGTTAPGGGPGHCPLMQKLARLPRADVESHRVTENLDTEYTADARLDSDRPEDVQILVEVIVAVLHDHYGASLLYHHRNWN